VSIIRTSDAGAVERELEGLPKGLSFFDPLLRHEAREAIEAGGEVYVSQGPEGAKDGLFIYDGHEATGTIFTKSREVFDRFFAMKPSSYIFSELDAGDRPREVWNLWQLDVEKARTDHRFRHHVSIDDDAKEIEQFLAVSQPETNPRWVGVALRNGDKCFVVKISNRIVGIAWMTIVGDVARSHGLFVEPKFRKMGIMKDNFQARLIYLKSRHVRALINEIAESNVASSSHAKSIGERIVGRMFLYESPEAKK
jgi:hypothetical protein